MSVPLRVLFVVGSNGTGGTELQIRALIAALARRGVHPTVVLLDGAEGTGGLPDNTEVVSHERPGAASSLFVYGRAVWKIRRRLKNDHFDVVHGVHARGYMVTAVAAAGVRNVRRVAWRRNLGIHLGRRGAAARGFLERMALRATDAVLVNSSDVAEYWTRSHGIASKKVVVVPNLLEGWRFDVVRKPSEDPFRIVAVGGLRPVKGHDVLVRAVAALQGAGLQLVVVGEGECRSHLTALAERLGVDLLLPGLQADPRPWLASASLYVHPSLSEGSSNAVLEAMAAGLPIVASDVGGMREMVGDAAVLVPPRNVEVLSGAIDGLVRSPDERKRLGQMARSRAQERFSEKAVVEKTIRVYKGDSLCVGS